MTPQTTAHVVHANERVAMTLSGMPGYALPR